MKRTFTVLIAAVGNLFASVSETCANEKYSNEEHGATCKSHIDTQANDSQSDIQTQTSFINSKLRGFALNENGIVMEFSVNLPGQLALIDLRPEKTMITIRTKNNNIDEQYYVVPKLTHTTKLNCGDRSWIPWRFDTPMTNATYYIYFSPSYLLIRNNKEVHFDSLLNKMLKGSDVEVVTGFGFFALDRHGVFYMFRCGDKPIKLFGTSCFGNEIDGFTSDAAIPVDAEIQKMFFRPKETLPVWKSGIFLVAILSLVGGLGALYLVFKRRTRATGDTH